MFGPAHAQIAHFTAPITDVLVYEWSSILLNITIIKQGHATLTPEKNDLDHDSVGLIRKANQNLGPKALDVYDSIDIHGR